MSNLLVKHGDSLEVFEYKNSQCMDIWYEGVPKILLRSAYPWQEYYRWDYDDTRVYEVETATGTMYQPYTKAKASLVNRDIVRLKYYKSGLWIFTRNHLLWDNNFVCAGCGGIANQAHHQGWSSKWQNYEHLGDEEKEEKCLVPICQDCHNIVTRVHSKKRWHVKHVESRIKIQSQSPYLQSGLEL